MNAQIIKLFGFFVVLFALLIIWTTRWTVIDANALNANPLNSRNVILAQEIKRGRIFADNGEVLAKSVRASGRTWKRVYPQGSLFAHTVGFFTNETGNASGLEVSDNRYLSVTQTGLNSVFGPLGGNQKVGDDVYTTLDPKAQQTAAQGLAGREGAVVALDPRTGAVLAMYSNPTFDPNNPQVTPACVAVSCRLDRATQGLYPPGSTFKIITTTAAINTGKFTPNSMINGDSPKLISGVPLQNDGNQSFGDITFTKALTYSVNTVFAQVAQDVGRPTMTQYMKRFGFYSKPPIDLPSTSLSPSIVLSPGGKPFAPASPNEDIGRIGFGQGGVLATPLQMAMVAAAVANGGKLMTPHLTARVVDINGQTVKTIQPTVFSNVMTPQTASEVNLMMRTVVDEGTGTPAQLGSGIPFAGKTGTASIGPSGSNETVPWFIGFAPANDPKVAVAVMIAKSQGGFGGQVAAPIAKDVVQTLLAEGK
ncbi:MAG TPA: penicillin-binding protein 2 [Solirubrobacteraceae bacterium]|nr:penicillin-binding protein 2 [Solirubrobacteraceae bacterium]